MLSRIVLGCVVAMLCVAQSASASDSGRLDGEAARVLWNQMAASTEKQDDGWLLRDNAAWTCKKFFDSETRQDRYECYKK